MWVCAWDKVWSVSVSVSVCVCECECECVCMWQSVKCVRVWVWVCVYVKLLYVKFVCEVIVCERLYVTKLCERWYVTKLCVCVSVCEVIVCERCYVTKLCVWVCVKSLYVKFDKVVCVCECVWSYCMWSYCMWEMLCDKVVNVWVCVREAAGGGGEGARDTESKTRTPHKVVGKKWEYSHSYPPVNIQKGVEHLPLEDHVLEIIFQRKPWVCPHLC